MEAEVAARVAGRGDRDQVSLARADALAVFERVAGARAEHGGAGAPGDFGRGPGVIVVRVRQQNDDVGGGSDAVSQRCHVRLDQRPRVDDCDGVVPNDVAARSFEGQGAGIAGEEGPRPLQAAALQRRSRAICSASLSAIIWIATSSWFSKAPAWWESMSNWP